MDDVLAFAHRLADAAGAVIRPYFGQALTVETKADDSPVSRADREAEVAIRALIVADYPDHAIFGEELGFTNVIPAQAGILNDRADSLAHEDSRLRGNDEKNYTWVIDPIDGTRAFLAGKREWGTLIALCENGVPILGILDQPVTGERWVGVKGKQTQFITRHSSASWNPPSFLALQQKKLGSHLRRNDDNYPLTAARISTTSRRYFTPLQATAFARLTERCGEVSEDGDCYAYGLLARGERELVIDAGLKPYDILALVPIIEGAGSIITDWRGAAITLTNYAQVVAASNANIHSQTLAILETS